MSIQVEEVAMVECVHTIIIRAIIDKKNPEQTQQDFQAFMRKIVEFLDQGYQVDSRWESGKGSYVFSNRGIDGPATIDGVNVQLSRTDSVTHVDAKD